MITPEAFLNKYQNQSLLYAPQPGREKYRGQCVQAVCFFVAENGKPVIWVETAFEWWSAKKFQDQYEYIANTPSAVPQSGDIIVWDASQPGSAGAGHIAIVMSANMNSFVSVDQNWGGKYVHAVTHNYNKVVGWLRLRNVNFGGVAAAPAGGNNDMINDYDNEYNRVRDAFNKLRGRDLGREEFRKNIVGLTWLKMLEVLSDGSEAAAAQQAQELGQLAIRDNWQGQIYSLQDVQKKQQEVINQQNQTITDFTTKLNDATLSNTQKQQALDQALAQLADQNSTLANLHDQLADASNKTTEASPSTSSQPSANLFTVLLAKLLEALPKRKS